MASTSPLHRKRAISGLLAVSFLASLLQATGALASADFTPARPVSNFQHLFSTDDYPASALRNNISGTVGYMVTVAADGTIAECTVTTTSGSNELDATTCNLLSQRARFDPARDENGQPVISNYSGRMTWQIPNGFPVIPRSVLVEFDVTADGKVENCQAHATPATPQVDQACNNIKEVIFPDAGEATKAPPHRRHVIFRDEVTIRDIPDKGGPATLIARPSDSRAPGTRKGAGAEHP